MKEFNLQAESIQRSEGSFSNTFFQEYGWLGSTINILSLGIRHVIAKFRIRGLTGASINAIIQTRTKLARTSAPSLSTLYGRLSAF